MKKNSIYEIFFSLLLMCFFVLCSFYIILLGAEAYSDMVENNSRENTYRIAFDYIRNRVNEAKDIILEDNMIILDNDEYDVIIYHDDYLKEMIVKDYRNNKILDGEKIIRINDFDINMNDNQLIIMIDDRKMELVKR